MDRSTDLGSDKIEIVVPVTLKITSPEVKIVVKGVQRKFVLQIRFRD